MFGTMAVRVEVTIKDTMAFWDDYLGTYTFNPDGYAPTNVWVFEVPDAWVSGGALTDAGLEGVCCYLYGATWRQGNGDGSRYVVLESRSRRLPAGDPRPAKVIEG